MSLYNIGFLPWIRKLMDLSREYLRVKVDRHRAEIARVNAEAHLKKAEAILKLAKMRAEVAHEQKIRQMDLEKASKLLLQAIEEIESKGGKVEFDKKQLSLIFGTDAVGLLLGLGITADHGTDVRPSCGISEKEEEKG